MAKERKSRKKLSKKVNMLKPLNSIDILKLGTDDDPCFGKHFDLMEDECRRCGDSTLCQIVSNQKTVKLRDKTEEENRFKDLELDDDAAIKLIKKLKKKDIGDEAIKKKLQRRYGFDNNKVSKLLKKSK